jgi:protein tyrosine phosphatase (PTP) superfamily phosphohydrolase (DUF442 family)
MSALDTIYNYLALSDTLATSGQPSEEQLAEISKAGFQVMINLGLSKADYALQDEAGLVKSLGMAYVHIPVLWEAPEKIDLETFFAVMDARRARRVYVHCAANMRVSTFVALYRILRLGWEREKAFLDVYLIWTPNERWLSFIDESLLME